MNIPLRRKEFVDKTEKYYLMYHQIIQYVEFKLNNCRKGLVQNPRTKSKYERTFVDYQLFRWTAFKLDLFRRMIDTKLPKYVEMLEQGEDPKKQAELLLHSLEYDAERVLKAYQKEPDEKKIQENFVVLPLILGADDKDQDLMKEEVF